MSFRAAVRRRVPLIVYQEIDVAAFETTRAHQADGPFTTFDRSADAPTFDPTWDTIRVSFRGDSIASVVEQLARQQKPPKREEETTRDYEVRLNRRQYVR
jgi:hypothetical protein